MAVALKTKVDDEVVLHFKYIFFKLFDFNARDYYNTNNPMISVLLPKMNYKPEEKSEVIKHAYAGVYQLAPLMFDKYIYFIDMYAEVSESEREKIFKELEEQKEMESFSQYIKQKGKQEGLQEGLLLGTAHTARESVLTILELRLGKIPESLKNKINGINDPSILKNLMEKAILGFGNK
jgi:hypothetical protein